MGEDMILEKELFMYENTPFHKKCADISREMTSILKNYGFTDKYLDFYRGNITNGELTTYVREVLENIDEYARHDLNHLWSMLSEMNCWHGEYAVSQIIHDQLMRIWYTDNYNGIINK